MTRFRFDQLVSNSIWSPLMKNSLFELINKFPILVAEEEALLRRLVKSYGYKPKVISHVLTYFTNAELVAKVFSYTYVLRVAATMYGRLIAEDEALPPLPPSRQ